MSRPRRTLRSAALALGALLVAGTSALANGRFPTARMLAIGPGNRADILAMATTFGVVVSRDGGRSWRWQCETALGYTSTSDPVVAVASDGTVIVGTEGGLWRLSAQNDCAPTRSAQDPGVVLSDLSADPSSSLVAGMGGMLAGGYYVTLSQDNGDHWAQGYSQSDLFATTVDVAPGHPQRVYFSGILAGSNSPVVLRSDDGGQHFVEATRNLMGGFDAWLAGVAADDPDHVFVRSNLRGLDTNGTALLESTDGASTLHQLTTTVGSMTGFARSPDGQTLWVGGTDRTDGVRRSRDGGRTWQQLASVDFLPLCLRYQAGRLFACTNESFDGYSLAVSDDDGDTFTRVMAFVNLPAPACECPRGSTVESSCGASWTLVQSTLRGDAGAPDPDAAVQCAEAGAPLDAAVDARDAAVLDVSVVAEAGFDAPGAEPATRGTGACNCEAGALGSRGSGGAGASGLLALVLGFWRRSGRGGSKERRGDGVSAA